MNAGSKWAYDYSDEELVEALISSAARAGFSNSGLVISAGAGVDMERLRYLEGVMLARLHKVEPPIRPVTIVVLNKNSSRRAHNWRHPEAEEDKEYTVRRVSYSKGNWFLSFVEGNREAKYPYENFNVVKKDAT